MPTYEYRCKNCGEVFDLFQSIKAKALTRTKCEKCGQVSSVTRLIGTGGGVIFKGSGFYQTDYRSDNYKKSAESETKSKTTDTGDSKTTKPAETSSETKTTKPAAKAPSESAPKTKPKTKE